MQRQGVGRRGEELAARHLQSLGLSVTDRNVRLPGGEIDLIAHDGDETVFVEVKTRIGDASLAPDELVSAKKLARIEQLAEAFLAQAGRSAVSWRIDVVAIVLARSGQVVRIDHFPGAFL